MSDDKMTQEAGSETMDYSARPFGYLSPDKETAMVCHQDGFIRETISNALKEMDYDLVEPVTFKEALRYMRFHIFDVIILDENFDTDTWETNYVLNYIQELIMPIRRQTFVVLISETYPTMDNMRAYNKSVNLIINKKEIAEAGLILRKEIAENNDFYFLFRENIRKFGKI